MCPGGVFVVDGAVARELALSFDWRGVEIDLRHVAGELEADDSYYKAAAARIDEVVSQRLRPAAEQGAVPRLSVFAIARIPLLVYLGSRIDDALTVDPFQRHRASESWIWPEPSDAEIAVNARDWGRSSHTIVSAGRHTGPSTTRERSLPSRTRASPTAMTLTPARNAEARAAPSPARGRRRPARRGGSRAPRRAVRPGATCRNRRCQPPTPTAPGHHGGPCRHHRPSKRAGAAGGQAVRRACIWRRPERRAARPLSSRTAKAGATIWSVMSSARSSAVR